MGCKQFTDFLYYGLAMPTSYTETFTYKGQDCTLSVSKHFNYVTLHGNFCFQVLINSYFVGHIVKGDNGLWQNLNADQNHSNLPFPLTEKIYQRIGVIIERELGEWAS